MPRIHVKSGMAAHSSVIPRFLWEMRERRSTVSSQANNLPYAAATVKILSGQGGR